MISRRLALIGLLLAAALTAIAMQAWRTPRAAPHVKVQRVLDVMLALQHHSGKLYFAGMAQNQELAGWYAWKLESALRELQNGQVEPYAYNGWDAAQLSHMLDPSLVELNATIKARQWDQFPQQHATLMARCTACHVATEHPFLVVRSPITDHPPAHQKFD